MSSVCLIVIARQWLPTVQFQTANRWLNLQPLTHRVVHISLLYYLGMECIENTACKNSSVVACFMFAMENCLPRHWLVVWPHLFVKLFFQPSCHIASSLRLLIPSSLPRIAISSSSRECSCDICDHPNELHLNVLLALMLLPVSMVSSLPSLWVGSCAAVPQLLPP
jgi:hypothetical protein